MNRKSTMQLLVGLLVGLSLSTALALDLERGGAKLTAEQKELKAILDTNNDGVISQAEAQRHPELAARFHELDRNNDGLLERAEFARFEVTEEDIEMVDDNDYDDWQ